MFDPEVLKSGKTRERRERALAILSAALEAVDPVNAIKRQVSLSGETMRTRSSWTQYRVGQRAYDLARYRNIYVIGGGKAGGSMAQAVEEILGRRVTAGLVKNKADFILVPSGGMWGPISNDKHLRARSAQSNLPIVFVHPIEFLVTGPGGIIWDRDFRGHQMDAGAEQIDTPADQKGVFLFDLPIPR